MPPLPPAIPGPNVLVVGETGVGKSSVINLIAGEQLATASFSAAGCTLEATPYDIALKDHEGLDHHIRLFDTVGVNEPQLQKKDYLSAIEKANKLICQLQKTGGIRLLLFCIRAGRVTGTMESNYHLFCDILCQNKVSVALVITGLENEVPMEKWWEENELCLRKCGLLCISHACVTAYIGPHNRFAKEYNESQTTVRNMLLAHVTGNGSSWQPDKPNAWIIDLAIKLLRWLKGDQALEQREQTQHLQDCQVIPSPADAKDLARKILVERRNNRGSDLAKLLQPFNVVVFGETGADKSFVVDLISGDKSTEVTRTSRPPTARRILLQNDRRPFCIWDTTGLDEPEKSLENYRLSIKQAYKLIKELEHHGGVHLLLFCMHGGNIGKSLQQNYKLFAEVLCKEKVPAYVVVTHLENLNESRVDSWWAANKDMLKGCGIYTAKYTCITANPGDGDTSLNKYKESRKKICQLLLNSQPKPSNEGLMKWLRSDPNQSTARDLVKKQPKDCGFSDKVAAAIATSMEEIDQLMSGST